MSSQQSRPQWSLIDKTNNIVTPIAIVGGDFPPDDASLGNLSNYRSKATTTISGIKKTRNAVLVLRCPHGLFITNGPILIDDQTKFKYLIQVQLQQPDGAGGTKYGDLVRFAIGKPSIDTNQYGVYLTLPLTATEIRTTETLDSEQHVLKTPQGTFLQRVVNYFIHAGADLTPTPPLIFVNSDSDIDLPSADFLKQDWLPTEPTTIKSLLDDIITRVSTPPPSGGEMLDSYYYYVTHPSATETINIYAERFGARSSGVIMDVLNPTGSAAQQDQSIQTDNVKYKNVEIVRGQNGAHTYPMAFATFSSDFSHAQFSADWLSDLQYLSGQYAIYGTEFFKCILDDPSSGPYPAPPSDPTHWENLSTATRYSPLTNNLDAWLANIDGVVPMIPVIPTDPYPDPPSVSDTEPTDYWGLMHDMNITRANYDRVDPSNQYENITFKATHYVLTQNILSPTAIKKPSDLPTAEIVQGFRVIPDPSASSADWPGTTSPGNHLLEYDSLTDPLNPTWHQSADPVLGDMVSCLERAEIWRFNGTSWVNTWQFSENPLVSSPFHAVKNIKIVNGPKGNLTAVEFQYNWDFTKDVRNATSRFCGFSCSFPWPWRAVTPIGGTAMPVGTLFGNPYIDFYNFDRDITGANIGYNNGLATENLGNLRGVSCQIRATFKNSNNALINGIYDIPLIWWFRDLFDRIVYTQVKVRRNGEFDYVQFDAGPYAAGWTLYDNRIDELFTLWGFTFPQNFFFKEREYTGVRFDWRFVKGMGCFWQDAYDENFFYKLAQQEEFDTLTQHLQQLASDLIYIATIGQIEQGQYVIDKSWFAIDELKFIKDAYVSSESVPVADSRQELTYADDQFDYVNLKSIAQGRKARAQFFPQFQTLDGYADVAMSLGLTFVAQGTRVPASPQTLICAEVTFTEDSNGFYMQVIGVKPFIAP